jgi:hypothetical protein
MKSKHAALPACLAIGLGVSASAYADPPRWAPAHGYWAGHHVHGSHGRVVLDRGAHRHVHAPARTVVIYQSPAVVIRPAHTYVYTPVPVYRYVPVYDRGVAGAVAGSVVGAAIGYHLATH